jgi:predicted RecA/RadA family phage recombinase
MKARFYQDGKTIDYTPTADLAAGDVVVLGKIIGIAQTDVPANTLAGLDIEGVFEFVKKANDVVTAGALIYWDADNKVATVTSGDTIVGIAVEASAATTGYVRVKINTAVSA